MDNAILMAITDDYAFCAACTLLSLRRNSRAVFESCDFIICQNDLSERSRQALQKICAGRAQFPEALTAQDSPWLEAECAAAHSNVQDYACEALRGFALSKRYAHVLWLESDTEICRPIDYLFTLECDIAGLFSGRAGQGRGAFSHLLQSPADDPYQFVQGAVILFTERLRRLDITPSDIRARADEYGTHHPNPGGGEPQRTLHPLSGLPLCPGHSGHPLCLQCLHLQSACRGL